MKYKCKKRLLTRAYLELVRSENRRLEKSLLKLIKTPEDFDDMCHLLNSVNEYLYRLEQLIDDSLEEED